MNRAHLPTKRAAVAATLALLAIDGAAAQSAAPAAAPVPAGTAARLLAAAEEAVARAPEAAAVDPLLRLAQFADETPPEDYRAALERAARGRRYHPSAALLLRFLQAGATWRSRGSAAARDAYSEQGFLQSWSVVGPFDNEGRRGVTTAYPPEAEAVDPAIIDHTYEGKERPVSWLPATAHFGRVPFERWLYPTVNTCAYAYTTVRPARPVDARVWAGSDGALAVWVGGRQAIRSERYYADYPDRFAADVRLPAGVVPLLVKVCGERGGMAFHLRLTDRSGKPLSLPAAPRPDGASALAAPAADPTPFETAYEELARRAQDGTAADRLVAGRVLHLSGMVDVTDNEAQKLLERAVDESPAAEALYWLMRATTDAVRAARAAQQLVLFAGEDPFLLAEAANERLYAAGVRAAEPVLRRALAAPGGADDATVAALRGRVLQARGLPGACSAYLEEWLGDHPAAANVLGQHRGCLLGEGRVDEASGITDRLAGVNRASSDLRLEVLRRAAVRAETETVRRLAAEIAADFPDDLGTLLDVAAQLFAGGAGEDAVALLRRLAEENPLSPTVVESLGRTLEALGRRDEAVEPYRRAVELEPQNQPLQQYLEFLDQRESVERRWALEFEALGAEAAAARAVLESTSPEQRDRLRRGRDLFRQQVDVIHPNGLSSRFGQTFMLVQTEDGAEQSRYMQVPFTPGEEDFELLRAVVHRPDGHTEDYETHYPVSFSAHAYYSDAGAESIVLPRLGVGDVVELRFRIDGRSRHNKFGEHFSQAVAVASLNPTDRFRYVLVAPPSKVLHVHLPEGLDVAAAQETDPRGDVVRTYEARGVPAIPEEPDAPPFDELSRPIEVSTFADWHELARWWWGLIKDQLQPDETIRQRVAEILEGAGTVDEKVARVFDWVIRNTRYVALEFGIHGWKPYRAHEVVSRGFGDCKDKGGLIYTMLAAAGIDARLVLLRTRAYRGRAVSDFPSLGQFDHVIAYVPGLDLYLDGTMTLAAATELPPMDRGAMALLVGPDDERLVTTPRDPRGPDFLEARYEHALHPDGSAATAATIRATGYYAQGIRGPLQAAETRTKRAEEMLGGVYPGLVLGEYSADGLDDFRQAVALTARADVPQLAAGAGTTFSLRAARPKDLAQRYASAAERELDVETYAPIHERQEIAYRLPDGATDVRVPERREARDGERSFVMEVAQEGSTVRVTYELHVPDSRIPSAEYARFRTFCAAVDTALAEPITYALP